MVWDNLTKFKHPLSGVHPHHHWLGYPWGYRAMATSDGHLDENVMKERKIARVRVNPHIPNTPDNGRIFLPELLTSGTAALTMTHGSLKHTVF